MARKAPAMPSNDPPTVSLTVRGGDGWPGSNRGLGTSVTVIPAAAASGPPPGAISGFSEGGRTGSSSLTEPFLGNVDRIYGSGGSGGTADTRWWQAERAAPLLKALAI